MADGFSGEFLVNGHPFNNLVNNSPKVSDSGYGLRSFSNMYGNAPSSLGFDGGWDALGLKTKGLPLLENEQFHFDGTLREVMSPVLVTS